MDINRAMRLDCISFSSPPIEDKASANVVSSSDSASFSKSKKRKKRWNKSDAPKDLKVQKKIRKDLKKDRTDRSIYCYNCGEAGHKSFQCKVPKKQNNKDKNVVHQVPVSNNFIAKIPTSTGVNQAEWWINTGATCHVSNNLELYNSFNRIEEEVSLADNSVVDVLGTGTVVIPLTSGKTLTLLNVKYIPSISKNFISGSLLCIAGMRLNFHAGKVVMTYNNVYFGNAYCIDGMYKLSVGSVNVNEIKSFE